MWTKYVYRPYITPIVDGDRVSRLYHLSLRKVDSTVTYLDDVLSWFLFVRPYPLPFIVDYDLVGVVRYAPKSVAR